MNINTNYAAMISRSNLNMKNNEPQKSEGSAVSAETTNMSSNPLADYKQSMAFMGGIINDSDKCKIPAKMPQTKGQMKDVTVTVAGGDMTQIKADAFFVPEFSSCASEGGVGAAIARGGAEEGLNEYDKFIEKNGELDFGKVILTKSGGGNSEWLLHGVTAGADADNQFEVAQNATYNALKSAQDFGLKSVVIPAIGTGIIGHLTNTESAQAILAGINKFAQEGGKMDVSVVVYSVGQGYRDFAGVLNSKSYENATSTVGTKEFDMADFSREMSGVTKEIEPESQIEDVSFVDVADNEEPKEVTIEDLQKYISDGRTNFDYPIFTRLIINTCPDIVNRLLDAKKPDGSQLFTRYDMVYQVISRNVKTLVAEPEKVFAILDNPKEVELMLNHSNFSISNIDGAVLHWAIKHPLESTRTANPGLFEPEKEITVDSVSNSIMAFKEMEPKFKRAGIRALEAHPELVEKMASLKDEAGRILFDSDEIGSFICNVGDNLDNESFMQKLNEYLNGSKNVSFVNGSYSHAYSLWRDINEG